MQKLDGRVAVVTGAASGIGLALARRFGEEGMRVVLSDVEEASLKEATQTLVGEGHRAIGVPCDVRTQEAVDALRDAALAEFGAVHVVCNNAGVARAPGGGPMWEPLAIAIIFGLAFSTVLTLGFIPVIYSLLFRIRYDDV